jgi:hypothetical protein
LSNVSVLLSSNPSFFVSSSTSTFFSPSETATLAVSSASVVVAVASILDSGSAPGSATGVLVVSSVGVVS